MKTGKKIVTIGPAVLDQEFQPDRPGGGTKHDCALSIRLGGGAANVGRQAAAMDGDVTIVQLHGGDALAGVVAKMAHDEFDDVVCVPLQEQTRCSALIGDECYTLRSKVRSSDELPAEVCKQLASAGVVVLAPLGADDWEFAEWVIGLNSHVVQQLSSEQLRHREKCCELAGGAWMTVINRAELNRWTDVDDVAGGIMWLRERGLRNVIVTAGDGVTAFLDGNWFYQAAFEVCEATQTVGAGDCFVGALAAAVADGDSWPEVLETSMGASALHVESAGVSRQAAVELVRSRRNVAYRPPVTPGRGRIVTRASLAIGLMLVAAIGWWL